MSSLQFVDGDPRLAVAVEGSGPPVVFLHGIGGNRSNWRRQVADLSMSFTCFAWDARGYGDSANYDGPLDFSSFGDDMARLLDHFGIAQAHFVGLSMGARILMDFAPRHLDRVATLTLCDCFYGFTNALSPEKQREYIELRERPLLAGKTFADLGATADRLTRQPQLPTGHTRGTAPKHPAATSRLVSQDAARLDHLRPGRCA